MRSKLIGAVILALLVLAGPITAFAATKTISAQLGTNQLGCQRAGEWGFVINHVNPPAPPATIQVTWNGAPQEDVPLAYVTGGVAHYTTTHNITLTIASATAQIDTSWNGEFNLSCPIPTAVQLSSLSVTTDNGFNLVWLVIAAIGIVFLGGILAIFVLRTWR